MSDRPTDAPALPEHLYVHVPLCRVKCAYCDFHSIGASGQDGDRLVAETLSAAEWWRSHGVAPAALSTLYLGGGTPTVLGAGLCDLIAGLVAGFGIREGSEITIEANPDSLDAGLARALGRSGVTRMSVGVQALDDGVLRWLGRAHDAEGARAAMRAVRETGADLAVDLMCGVPGVGLTEWNRWLEEAVAAGAAHMSVYPLTIEEGTPLAARIERGEVRAPDEDESAEAMCRAEDVLTAAGFTRYETANYALPGHESRHNLAYWTGKSYLGCGGGAHGMLDPAQARALGLMPAAASPPGAVGRIRYRYPDGVYGIEPSPAPDDVETLTPTEAAREDVMLGLRVSAGVEAALVQRAGVGEVVADLVAEGLLEVSGARVRATRTGWLLGNEVFRRVWALD